VRRTRRAAPGIAGPAFFCYHNGVMLTPLKQEIVAILERDGQDARVPVGWPAVRVLISLLCSASADLRFAAARALGRLAATLAEKDPEKVRDLLRRLFWSTNDESGASGLGVPEAIGEIIAGRPDLWAEYVGPLLNLLDEPGLQAGVLRATGRLAGEPALVRAAEQVLRYLAGSSDSALRTLALQAGEQLGLGPSTFSSGDETSGNR